ncbi:major tail protein [Pediococcus pentosaceus]|uniref:major tail protein n=1 Tax=Pediococcus pentosaceus TaxID=1255 RepID=UPI0011B7F4BE|nr:major tail protein [Pediococcus pentosaceus]QDZ69504.1 phage tail protein [Pediococcus pentosaceus]
MYVGWKRLKIQPFNEDGTKKGDLIIVEGKPHKGGTVTAEITGLTKDTVKVDASDIDYYISRGGVGDIKGTLGILDLPEETADILSGYRVDEDKITYAGNSTMPPYCAFEMETKEDTGEIALYGFYQSTWSREKISLGTLDSNKTFTPEPDSWTVAVGASTADDDTNGESMQKFIGDATADAETIKKFEDQLFNPKNGSDTDPDDKVETAKVGQAKIA